MKSKNNITLVLSLIYFFDFAGLFLVLPIFAPVLLKSTGVLLSFDSSSFLRTLIFGALISTYGVAQFMSAPFLGSLSDTLGRKKILLWGLIIGFIGYILCGLSFDLNNLALLFIGRFLVGIASANTAVLHAYIADICAPAERPVYLGFLTAGGMLGMVVGPLMGGFFTEKSIASWFTLATPFWLVAFFFAILIGVLAFVQEQRSIEKKSFSPLEGFYNIIDALRRKNLRYILAIFFLFLLSTEGFFVAFPLYAVDEFGISRGVLGHIIALGGFMATLSVLLLNKFLSKKFSSSTLLIGLFIGLILSYLLVLIPDTQKGLYIPYALWGLIAILIWIHLLALALAHATDETQGKIMGVAQSLLSLSILLGPLLIGFFGSFHFSFGIWFCFFCALLSALLFIRKKNAFSSQ